MEYLCHPHTCTQSYFPTSASYPTKRKESKITNIENAGETALALNLRMVYSNILFVASSSLGPSQIRV